MRMDISLIFIAMTEGEAEAYQEAILSILRAYILLFNTDYFDFNPGKKEDLTVLLDFPGKPDKENIGRIISILKTWELCRRTHLFETLEEPAHDTEILIAYLKTLLKKERKKGPKKRLVNPENLGRTFYENGFGVPLFGKWRSGKPPRKKGIFLCQTHSEEGEVSEIAISRRREEDIIEYEGLGLNLTQEQDWLHCLVLLREKGHEIFMDLPGWDEDSPVFEFSRSRLFMADKFVRKTLNREPFDPAEECFLYFFYEEPFLKRKVVQFLSTTWSAFFGIPGRRGENIAFSFIQKLLQK